MAEPSGAQSFRTFLPLDIAQQLFTQWIARLATDRSGMAQAGGGSSQIYTYGDRGTRHFQVEIEGDEWQWKIEVREIVGIPVRGGA